MSVEFTRDRRKFRKFRKFRKYRTRRKWRTPNEWCERFFASQMARAELRFWVNHQFKQRLILRALEQMDTSNEAPKETAAVTEMIVELERIMRARRRRYGYRTAKGVNKTD